MLRLLFEKPMAFNADFKDLSLSEILISLFKNHTISKEFWQSSADCWLIALYQGL